MSRTIHVTPRSAARYSFRLELVPSWRLAAAWVAWLVAACGAAFASPWPWPLRAAICVGVAVLGVPGIAGTILLRGRRAVRTLAGAAGGGLHAWIGGASESVAVEEAAISFRLGSGVLLLRLQTARGSHTVCIDGSLHDQSSFRGLCRALRRPLRRGS